MKNLVLFINLIILLSMLLVSCNRNEFIVTPLIINKYSIISGDTVKTVINKDYKKTKGIDLNGANYLVVGDTIITYKEPLLPALPSVAPDLNNLKNNDDSELKGKPLRYVAIGGSLTAGVRDGGYFNEGIITSYPNLIARQMRLAKFEQPLFEKENYNGYGRKAIKVFNPTGGPVPKFNEAHNNSAIVYADEKTVTLKVYQEKEALDNFALPNFSVSALFPWRGTNEYEQIGLGAVNNAFFSRIAPKTEVNSKLIDKIFSKKFDFISIEFGYTEVLNSFLPGYKKEFFSSAIPDKETIFSNEPSTELNMSLSPELILMRKLRENKGTKAVLLNIPDFLSLPYFKFVQNEMAQKIVGNSAIKYESYFGDGISYFETQKDLLLPTSSIDSLLSNKIQFEFKKGIYNNKPVSFWDILHDAIRCKEITNRYNEEILSMSEKFGFPIVDIRNLYEKIVKGQFVTDDGIRVDASYSTDNFFSSDGINPSAFGQAIIANEVIKVLNRNYKTTISLISTKEYLVR
ncbi:hypothetical protein [Emticicia sp. BO119]|uniref:hypothetical protein n=1 Tax=Emticicia sp. BO119 TaxID=2757768 RepID=UPI0015EFE871|nr:hypothetical protein [Emticicia sp. BO119]MBA4851053.1 hypothetical protein [Emticicia sp. BO119]